MPRFMNEERIEELSKRPFALLNPEAVELMKTHRCTICREEIIGEWKDDLSWKEYNISGMCQKCQDKFFKGG